MDDQVFLVENETIDPEIMAMHKNQNNSSNESEKPKIRPQKPEIEYDILDIIILIVLTFISYWTRHYRIQFPEVMCFDETHFGKFNNGYVTHEYFFDIHPPTAKLLIYALSKAFQYDGSLDFVEYYYKNSQYINLRQIPAMFASFCAPLIYLAAKCYGLSRAAQITASIMIICETSMITEGRFLLTDGILHFFVCLAIFSLGNLWSKNLNSFEWYMASIFAGFCIGFAISTKFTALSLTLLCAFQVSLQVIREMPFDVFNMCLEIVTRGVVIVVFVLSVYFLSFATHIQLLPFIGPGKGFLYEEFQHQLINKSTPPYDWTKRMHGPGLIPNIILLNERMNFYNMGLTGSHPSGSSWYQWPFLRAKFVAIWSGTRANILTATQPFNVVTSTFAAFCFVFISIFFFNFSKQYTANYFLVSIFFVGYFTSLVPFILVPRSLFLYHFIIPLIFGIVLYSALLDKLIPVKIGKFFLQISQFITIAAYIYWAPYCYGTTTNVFARKWVKNWW